MSDSALVLGGGGITGIAWEVGVLHGLRERGVDLTTAGLIIGTSAGSVVGALIANAVSLAAQYEKQRQESKNEPHHKLRRTMLLRYAWALFRSKTIADFGVRMGALSMGTKTETEAERRPAFERLLGAGATWSQTTDLKVTAVNAATGEFKAFDRHSGVDLLSAVGASASVPGVWPAVTIDGERFVDGGMRTGTNADLAAGCQRVVIVAPAAFGAGVMVSAEAQADALRAAGAKVILVTPDAAAKKAIGRDVLDPKRRPGSALAGYEQAARVRDAVAAVWS